MARPGSQAGHVATEVAAHGVPRHAEGPGDLADRRPSPPELVDPLEPVDTPLRLASAASRRGEAGVAGGGDGRAGSVTVVGSMAVAASASSFPDTSAVRRIGFGGLEGFGDDGQMALEQALDGLAHVLQQVPSVGDLPGLGAASAAAWA